MATQLMGKRFQPTQSRQRRLVKCSNAARKGAVMVLLLILLPILLMIAAFAISLTYMESVRVDMQIATDAVSRAACRSHALSLSQGAAKQRARDIAALNTVGGVALSLSDSDIQFGAATRDNDNGRYSFTAGVSNINSVMVNLSSDTIGGMKLPFAFGLSTKSFRSAQTAIASQSDMDLILVIDRSGSMAYGTDEVANLAYPPKRAPSGWTFGQPVPSGSRWLNAVDSIGVFLNYMSNSPQVEKVALCSYNHYSSLDVDLTADYSSILSSLGGRSNNFEAGGTAIGDGIWNANWVISDSPLRRSSAIPVVIVLTDGIMNYGSDPLWAATFVNDENHAFVYTITFSDEADIALMQSVASVGGGKHYHAATANQLNQVFESIAKDLPILTTK